MHINFEFSLCLIAEVVVQVKQSFLKYRMLGLRHKDNPEILKLALQTALWNRQCQGSKGNKIIDFIRISVVDAVLFPDQRVHCCRQSGPLTGVEWKAQCSFLLLAWKRHKWAVEALLAERIKLHDYPGQTITWITADLHCGVLCSTALSLA